MATEDLLLALFLAGNKTTDLHLYIYINHMYMYVYLYIYIRYINTAYVAKGQYRTFYNGKIMFDSWNRWIDV